MTPAVIYVARSKDEEPGKDSTGDQLKDIHESIGNLTTASSTGRRTSITHPESRPLRH